MRYNRETNEVLNDDEIDVAALEHDGEENVNKDSDDDDDQPPARVSHTDATNTFEIGLQYIEQNSTSTPMDFMWIKTWRKLQLSRISICKQISITELFTK